MKETDANVSRRIDDERKVFLISLLMMNSKNSSFFVEQGNALTIWTAEHEFFVIVDSID